MDSIFLLDPDFRRRFLQSAARGLGCLYICLWSYIPHPSNCLVCMDGWFNEDDSSVARRFFEAYRRNFCRIHRRLVPGLAFKEGLPYLELSESGLMSSASLQVQQQFYQEAGIKTAAFIGCNSGEIEIGFSALSNISMQADIKSWFSDFIQQSQALELMQPDVNRPSPSSSSSFFSLSMGSPEYSSLLLNKPSASCLPNTFKHSHFPTPASDDAAMTRVMLAVISSGSSSSSSSSPSSSSMLHQNQQPAQTYQYPIRSQVGAFRPYNSTLSPRVETKGRWHGQKMIKMAIALSKRADFMRLNTPAQETRPTSNQLNHMINERKRREKLNESFFALKSLLPPGSKKDKASVLASTRDYLNTLKAQVSELEEKNQMLEKQLQASNENAEEPDDSNERVRIIREIASSSRGQRISLRITVKEECDLMELVLRVLECLKAMGLVSLVGVDASTLPPQTNSFVQVLLRLHIEADDWDEASFKEAVTRAVDGVPSRPRDHD